jgi:hypothetical protein
MGVDRGCAIPSLRFVRDRLRRGALRPPGCRSPALR